MMVSLSSEGQTALLLTTIPRSDSQSSSLRLSPLGGCELALVTEEHHSGLLVCAERYYMRRSARFGSIRALSEGILEL